MDRNIPPTEGDVMLVLTREQSQRLVVTLEDGRKILIDFLRCTNSRTKVGIDAPITVRVEREEIVGKPRKHA